jgi:hypothetical protein
MDPKLENLLDQDQGKIRQSMAVINKNNTGALKSRFEQLNIIAQTGEATRNRRKGATFSSNTNKTPQQQLKSNNNSSTKISISSSRTNNSTTKNISNISISNKNSSSSSSSLSTSSSSLKNISNSNNNNKYNSNTSSNSIKNTFNVSKKTNLNNSNTDMKKVELKSINPSPVTTNKTIINDDENEIRSKPMNKPKPRQSAFIDTNDIKHLQEQIQKVKKDKEEIISPSIGTSSSTISLNSSNSTLDISDRWRINYDELEFDELVSSGSAGEVYLGYYFGTPVAIKKLFSVAPDQKHLVTREFQMLQGLNHPNIVQFLGICDHSSGIYLITEYVEHGDLFDLLVFGTSDVGWKAKVKIALQIATACYYLHSKNVIHRDLKSQNILIGENFKVKLCDLGLATIIENKKRMTICGTHEWMAPEIALENEYDEKVDVFSFGIVLTEMITNQPPKRRSFDEKLAFNVPQFLESAPKNCPPELIQMVIDCTQFEPTSRPSMKDLVPRLKNLLNSLEQ